MVEDGQARGGGKGPRNGETDARALARSLLTGAQRILVMTGAGISADSGVPVFRGEEGLWKEHRPEELATPAAFARDPRLVWEWYAWRRDLVGRCEPNEAHLALARFASSRPGEVDLVTQNVDGLHTRAAEAVAEERPETAVQAALPLELHGCLFRVRCTGCGTIRGHRRDVDASSLESLPRCDACGELLRPDVVWFGEGVPEGSLERALGAARSADVALVIGTSGVVQPAAGVVTACCRSGGTLVEVNPGATALSDLADVVVRERAAVGVPPLLEPRARNRSISDRSRR